MSKKKLCGKCGNFYDFNGKCSCYVESKRNDYQKSYYAEHKEAQRPLMSKRWSKKRSYIINRDGGHCQRCLIKFGVINDSELQVHHIKPRSKYPELMYEDGNLITLCKRCNLEIGIEEELDFTAIEKNRENIL